MTITTTTAAPSDPNANPVTTIQQTITTQENRPVEVPLPEALRLTVNALYREYPAIRFFEAAKAFLVQIEKTRDEKPSP